MRRSNNMFPLLLLVILCSYFIFSMTKQTSTMSMTDLYNNIKSGNIKSAVVYPNKHTPIGTVKVQTKEGQSFEFTAIDVKDYIEIFEKTGLIYKVQPLQTETIFFDYILPAIVIFGIGMFFGQMKFISMMGGGGASIKPPEVSKMKEALIRPEDINVRFSDIAGIEEEKAELEEVVDFLKYPEKYQQLGAKVPKGVLLIGEPGTGKTLMAKAVAAEAGVSFFSVSGSDFVEMYVGVGAARVRELFQEAKKNKPCIVFIDEIDTVARKRGSGVGGGNDEREQTLNQLLVEMDGFVENSGIMVLAATNREDVLDNAVVRAGRFDRKINVHIPDVKGRKEILKIHSRKKPLGEDVDLDKIAKTTSGFTGADLENLLNESAILAAKNKRNYINEADILDSYIKIGVGVEKKSRIVSKRDRQITAYHEAGHAILFNVLPLALPVSIISIIPTGGSAAGYTMPIHDNDDMFVTKEQMYQDILVGLGGRIAEEIIFKDVTTGASSDIRSVTNTARRMVVSFGFTKSIGMVNLEDNYDKNSGVKFSSDHTQQLVDEEVKNLIDKAYKEAKEIILEHMDVLHATAKLLLEKEKINREEFEKLFSEEERQKNKEEFKEVKIVSED